MRPRTNTRKDAAARGIACLRGDVDGRKHELSRKQAEGGGGGGGAGKLRERTLLFDIGADANLKKRGDRT